MSGSGAERENLRRKGSFGINGSNSSEENVALERIIVCDDLSEERIRNQKPNVVASDPPIIKRELKEIIDNFGKSLSEPAVKHEAKEEVSEKSHGYQHLTYTESERPILQENYNGEGAKLSEDTTDDGKIIEICEETHVCHEECTCRMYNESLSGVEPLPAHYIAESGMNPPNPSEEYDSKPGEILHKISSASPPLNLKKVKRHMEKAKEKSMAPAKEKKPLVRVWRRGCNVDESYSEVVSCVQENADRGYTNRYNYNHVKILRGRDTGTAPLRQLCGHLFSHKKKYKQKNIKDYASRACLYEKDSGETIPQLYKAKLCQLSGTVPERFTFKAYTGACPFESQEGVYAFRDSYQNRRTTQHNDGFYPVDVHDQKPQGVAVSKSLHVKSNKTKDFLSTRACLNFEGNEYISTRELPERIDIYCFDHLNTSYFRTSDQPPPLITEVAMERSEAIATRFWAELFGFVHIFIAFIIAFILQFYKFLLYSLIRPVMIGVVQLTSDYFFKPLLTIIYNGFTQPLLVFFFNVAASFRDVCLPIARGIGYFFAEIAVILRAIRIIDLSKPCQPTMKDSCC